MEERFTKTQERLTKTQERSCKLEERFTKTQERFCKKEERSSCRWTIATKRCNHPPVDRNFSVLRNNILILDYFI